MTDRVHLELYGLELIACERYNGARLTRGACGQRFVAERDDRVPPGYDFGRCAGCPVGAEHARELASEGGGRGRGRKRRGGAKRERDIAEAMARKASAASAGAQEALTSAVDRDVSPQNITQTSMETPSRRWCDSADEVLVEPPVPADVDANAPESVETSSAASTRRGPGAPRPRASDAAEEWLAGLTREQREHVAELVLDAVSATDAARRYARAVLLRRLVGLSVAETIEHLGSPEGLDAAACRAAVARGRWIVSRALRQRSLLADPRDVAELEAVSAHVVALMAAERSDAGERRPAAQHPRKALPEPVESPSIFDLLDGAA